MQNSKLPGIMIRQIEVYRPENFKTVDEIIEEFKSKGKDIEFLAKEFLGKDTIHLCKANEENGLTMAKAVTHKILESTGLNGNDFDMIVVSTTLPEYVAPITALIIHDEIKGKEDVICYDINANCIGSVLALSQIYNQMKLNPRINRTLLIGADFLNFHCDKENESLVANFGDAACAIVIEKTQGTSDLIDSKCYVDPGLINTVVFPKCGTSNIYNVEKDEMRMYAEQMPSSIALVVDQINKILAENELTVNDISAFCFSQSAQYFTEYLKDRLEIPDEKAVYIGDKYGYTATSSPFIALYEMNKRNTIKRGDYILFWTVGVGGQHIFSIIRY